MILVVTNKHDVTSDLIVRCLQQKGAHFIRLNTEEILSDWSISWSVDGCILRGRDIEFRSSDVAAVYYRRPRTPAVASQLRADTAFFVRRETDEFCNAVFDTFNCYWFSKRDNIRRAELKTAQLLAAKKAGFVVPETLITTDPDVAGKFLARKPSIVKPLSSGKLTADQTLIAFTSDVDNELKGQTTMVRLCPHLFQERIDKISDVRVTVVGDDVFACEIDSQSSPNTALDFRRGFLEDTIPTHRQFELPELEAQQCVALTRSFGLEFSAIDLARTSSGYVFFEMNPNGQWGWVEQLTGQPICLSIVTRLLRMALIYGG